MIFRWLRNRRRARLCAVPFPASWEKIIAANVLHDEHLSAEQRIHLRRFVRVFVAEKNWEGCRGQVITDEVKVTIAAQAALLTFGRDDLWFDYVLSILVYPDEYLAKDLDTNADGIVTETGQARLGEAVWQGPVILSWRDVLAGGRREYQSSNLVLHEFAHQLDMANGRFVDGIPPLDSRERIQRWIDVMKVAHDQLLAACTAGQWVGLDCYGAQNAAEFLAVAVEAFFENSVTLRRMHPDVYQLLQDYFRLDPCEWGDDAV